MDGQMSIFDFIPSQEQYMPLIEKLDKELKEIFEGYSIEDKEYTVWEHVPKLGKRYCIYVCNIPVGDTAVELLGKFCELSERYKRYSLEVELCSNPGEWDEEYKTTTHNFMISSIWTTKKHKEPDINCKHVSECMNFAYGCAGTNYWCNRYG